MADWNASNITLTAKGSSALSRVEAGDGSLTITRVVASEQYVQESTLREVTTLSVENLELTIIDRHEVEDGGSVIQAQLSNLNLTKKFTLNEIGVFATHSSDPDNEFLYIIAQVDLNTGDEIPLYSVTPVTATYDIYLYNVGADKVNVTISSAGLVTYEALNAICGLVKRSNAYELGQIANHASLPTGMYLECVVAGTTASTPIPIPTSPKEGDMVKDGSVTWVLSKTLSSRKLGYRQPSTAYTVGNIAYHSALPTGWCLKCTTAGTTSAGDITPSSTIGDTITDGGVTWTVVKYTLTTDVPPLASALATPRKIELTGNVTGSADFDGSKDIQIVAATPLCIPLSEHITWTVTGTQQGDFDSLQTALNEAKKYRPIAEGALITINLLSGFELAEPIRVSRCDLRHVEITSDDTVIARTSKVAALAPSVPDNSLWSNLHYLQFIQFYKVVAPTLRFKLKKDDSSAGSYHNCEGVDYNYSQGFIDGASFESFKIGVAECYAVYAACSNISVKESTFNGNFGDISVNKGSALHAMNLTCTGAISRGISVWGGVGAIEGCTITGCRYYGIIFAHCEGSISEYNTESDSADTRRTKISNCGWGGVDCDFGGTAAINRVDITGCGTGVLLEDSGNLVRIGADTNISGNTNNYSIATNTITSQGLILTA